MNDYEKGLQDGKYQARQEFNKERESLKQDILEAINNLCAREVLDFNDAVWNRAVCKAAEEVKTVFEVRE